MSKNMLRRWSLKRRQDDYKNVAYFAAMEYFGRPPMAKLAVLAAPKSASNIWIYN